MNKKLGDINVTVGDNNQIGNIGHVVNVNANVKWELDENLRDGIIANVPKDKLATVWFWTGNDDSLQVAQKIYQFMKTSGFQLFGNGPQAQIYLEPFDDVVFGPGEIANNVFVGIPKRR
jgi:hypothetical protein